MIASQLAIFRIVITATFAATSVRKRKLTIFQYEDPIQLNIIYSNKCLFEFLSYPNYFACPLESPRGPGFFRVFDWLKLPS